jgi:hypothetical protein
MSGIINLLANIYNTAASIISPQKKIDNSFLPTDSRDPVNLPPPRTSGPYRVDSTYSYLNSGKVSSPSRKRQRDPVRQRFDLSWTMDSIPSSSSSSSPSSPPRTPPGSITSGLPKVPGAPMPKRESHQGVVNSVPFPDLDKVASPVHVTEPSLVSIEKVKEILTTPPLPLKDIPRKKKPFVVLDELDDSEPESVDSEEFSPASVEKYSPPLSSSLTTSNPLLVAPIAKSQTIVVKNPLKKSKSSKPRRNPSPPQEKEDRFEVKSFSTILRCSNCRNGSVRVVWEPVIATKDQIRRYEKKGYKFTLMKDGERMVVYWDFTWEPYFMIEETLSYELSQFCENAKKSSRVYSIEHLELMEKQCRCHWSVRNRNKWIHYHC